MIFLGTIVYVLVTKLRESNSVQNVQYRQVTCMSVYICRGLISRLHRLLILVYYVSLYSDWLK